MEFFIDKKSFLIFALFFILIFPNVSLAQNTGAQPGQNGYQLLVKCSGNQIGSTNEKECSWNDFIEQINKVINFLFYLSVILATISFIWCGFKFLTAGGNEDKAKEAKDIFYKVVIGFIWVFAAWLLVHFITSAFSLNEGISILGQ